MALGNWDVDLDHGTTAEETLRAAFAVEGRVEVKRDRYSWETHKVFVEYESRGEPSGIATSQADLWCFMLDDANGKVVSAVLVPLDRLKGLARERLQQGGPVRGGDDLTSLGVLVPLGWLMPWRERE